jgi:type IV pilus assembly protein PilE
MGCHGSRVCGQIRTVAQVFIAACRAGLRCILKAFPMAYTLGAFVFFARLASCLMSLPEMLFSFFFRGGCARKAPIKNPQEPGPLRPPVLGGLSGLNAKGLTLIELLATLAVVAILASIAFPTYQDAVRKSRRADAHVALSDLQLAQERHRSRYPTYAQALGPDIGQINRPARSPDGFYTLTISQATATGYHLTATAAEGSSQLRDEGCTEITVTATGNSVIHGPHARCWNR